MDEKGFMDFARKRMGMAKDSVDWEKHDAQHHGGHFDASTMRCSLRERESRDDEADALEGKEGGNRGGLSLEDTEYLDAVLSRDTERCAQMVRMKASLAMKGTRILAKDGLPMVIAHRTMKDFNEFKHRYAQDKVGRMAGLGLGKGKFYFVASEYENFMPFERGQRVMRLFADVKNPISKREYVNRLEEMMVDEPNASPDSPHYDYTKRDELIARLDRQIIGEGHDGIWDEFIGELAVFKPTQIKLADPVTYDDDNNPIPLSQRFEMGNADIRK